MKPLFNDVQFSSAKSGDKLPCECYTCGTTFHRIKKDIQKAIKHPIKGLHKYCSVSCTPKKTNKPIEVECIMCKKIFKKGLNNIRRSPNHFCSKSCAATHNNTHKKYGIRRSKLELWLETQLPISYPSLEFHFARKDAINSELDIYIPSLKLAFELNGIFHYEPIFGPEQLKKIQNNDQRKHAACYEAGIEMCWIDTSSLEYFKEGKAIKYLDIIKSIINKKLAGGGGVEPRPTA